MCTVRDEIKVVRMETWEMVREKKGKEIEERKLLWMICCEFWSFLTGEEELIQ